MIQFSGQGYLIQHLWLAKQQVTKQQHTAHIKAVDSAQDLPSAYTGCLTACTIILMPF